MRRPPGRDRALALGRAVIVCAALAWGLGMPAASGQSTAGGSEGTAGPNGTVASGEVVTPLFSVRRAPEFLGSRAADDRLAARVDELLAEAPPDTCVRVTDHGRQIVSHQADRPLIPASLNKLLTAHAAVELLGAETTLDTVVLADRSPGPDGTVDGNLYLVGGGDPLLFTEGFRVTLKDSRQTQTDFAAVADQLAALGLSRISGDVVGDESRYDTERGIPTWSPAYQAEGAAGSLSALMVNRGQTGLAEDPDTPTRVRKLGEPAELAAQTLTSLLARRDVTVGGTWRAGSAPADAVELLRVPSPTVEELAGVVLQWSDNSAAELLTKEMGLQTSGQGTTVAGLSAITGVASDLGLAGEELVVVDGSGLDRGNRMSCDVVADLLDRVGPTSPLGRGLAVAGESGTLRQRLAGSRLAGRLHGKTGTLAEVNALAGFVETDGGATLTFVINMNGEAPDDYKLTDELALLLLDYPDAPAPDQLGPQGP